MNAFDNLKEAADIYSNRHKLYGNNYKIAGLIFMQLFPNGINIETYEDYNRFAIVMQIINKLIRYSFNWNTGHPDSLTDMSVYAMILKELDDEYLGEK
jgi:hypothetical protein